MTVFFDSSRERWRYDLRVSGKRYAGYCVDPDTGAHAATKTEAKRIEALVKAAALKEAPVPAAPVEFTVSQMFMAYATRKKALKDWPNKQVYVADLGAYFDPDTPITDLTEQRIWEYIAWARAQPVMIYRGGPKARTPEEKAARYAPSKDGRTRADSTINRYLVTLREALAIAHSLKDGAGRPLLPEMPKVPKLAEAEHLPRPVSDDDLQAIMTAAPQHLADGIMLARLMGFRKGEVFSLMVEQIDFVNRCVWLDAESTKAKRAEAVPANPEAIELLSRLVAQAKEWKVEHLFTYQHGEKGKRQPVKNPKRAWRTACKAAGVKHRFHDTKASFVTAVAHVAPAAVTQQLARHKSYETTRRYLRVADTAARSAVEAATIRVTKAVVNGPPQPTSTQEFHTAVTEAVSGPPNSEMEKASKSLDLEAFSSSRTWSERQDLNLRPPDPQ
ncbi:tyrosine-type recombinase/integrase, partial [Azospirillum sp. TSH58]|uniref:tyrosine-type recombinase/integrase n=1 Tax=Azospirillum sp. TSH58 TaxID=664962 RepID=UPI000D613203